MKNYIAGIGIFLSGFLFAQKQEAASKMPVYFGCEKEVTDEGRLSCLNKILGNNISHEIEFFSNIADYLHVSSAQTKLVFTINAEGNFSDVSVHGSNPIFNSFVNSGLVMIQNKMNKLKVTIEPAKDKKNKSIPMQLSLPVRFESQEIKGVYDAFPADSRVLFTVSTQEEDIEVRMDKNYGLTTYGNNGRFTYFLGKYNNLFELAFVEPYGAKIEESFQSGYTLLTKGEVEGKNYTVRLKNFFSTNPTDMFLVEVFREENDQWVEFHEYKSKEEFNNSPFAKLTYR